MSGRRDLRCGVASRRRHAYSPTTSANEGNPEVVGVVVATAVAVILSEYAIDSVDVAYWKRWLGRTAYWVRRIGLAVVPAAFGALARLTMAIGGRRSWTFFAEPRPVSLRWPCCGPDPPARSHHGGRPGCHVGPRLALRAGLPPARRRGRGIDHPVLLDLEGPTRPDGAPRLPGPNPRRSHRDREPGRRRYEGEVIDGVGRDPRPR